MAAQVVLLMQFGGPNRFQGSNLASSPKLDTFWGPFSVEDSSFLVEIDFYLLYS